MDWGALLRNPSFWETVAPVAAGVTGAVMGNRAQGKAISASKDELLRAREASGNYLREALNAAAPMARWGMDQGREALDSGYGEARNIMAPYLESGNNALARLSSLAASTPRISSYGGMRPQTRSAPGPAQINAQPGFTPRPMMPRSAPPPFAVPGNALAAALGRGRGGFDLSDNRVKQPGFAVRNAPTFGMAGGLAAGALGAGAGLGMAGGTALGSAVLPGIGTAAGALIGGLVGRLTRRGREKEAAAEGVDEFSGWVWNDVMPRARRGEITRDQAQQAIDSGFQEYVNWLNQNLGDKTVATRSAQSQRQYLDQGLAGPNGWASVR